MGNSYDNIIISKKERRHVEKRIDTRLRIAKKTNKDIENKGIKKLTDKIICAFVKY